MLQGHRKIPRIRGDPAWPPEPAMVSLGPCSASREGAHRAELGPPVLGVPSPTSLRNSRDIFFQQSKGALLALTVALGGLKEGDEP